MSSPLRILFVIARGDAFGGSSRHVIDMASRLRRDGHEALVVVGGEPDMVVPSRLAERGVPFVCVPQMRREIHPSRDFGALRAIRREVSSFEPDLVSTHASKGGFLGRLACIGKRVPVLYTPHCWSFVDGFPGATRFRWLERLAAPLSTRIVAVSEAEREFGLRHRVGSPGRTITIHNGLGEATAAPERPENAGAVRIVMVGRFEEQKDQRLLIEALGELAEFDWRLTFIGDGPLQEGCGRRASELGIADRVRFAGYLSAVEDELPRHDVFALISNWEGFPRSILEAMRCGLPVIASDVGGSREAVLDGVTGRVVARGDRDGLVEALAELLGSPGRRAHMGRRGHELYRERFTFDAMYQNYLRLYASLTRAPRGLPRTRGRGGRVASKPNTELA